MIEAKQWTDEQHAAYALGMQTEREHQEALARLAMEKHAAANAALVAQVAQLQQRCAELEAELAKRKRVAWGAYEFWDNPLDDEYNKESEGGNE